MLLSGLEIQPLFATIGVLLDNCSSLFDCWDTLGAAAAAAVGAGAAAVFVGGLLLTPGETTGIVEEGLPPVAPGTVAAAPTPPTPATPTVQASGPATTVAQAPPASPAYTAPQVQASPPTAEPPAFDPGGSVAQPAPVDPGAGVQPDPASAAAPSPVGATQPATETSPAMPPPTSPASAEPAATTAGPVAAPVLDPGLAAGLAAGVAPVASTLAGLASSRAGSSGTGRESSGDDEGDDDSEVACDEVDASLFGLPDINTRHDCPGTRPGMPPNYAGLDFTSNDDHGHRMELPFEAGVTGEVTYVGGAFNTVQVTLENGNRIQFLHAAQVLVQVGRQVEPTTVLGMTGGTGPYGPNQYEIHLHVQAFDRHGNLIDPDCALSGGENRLLKRNVAPPEPAPSQHEAAPGATADLSHTQPIPEVQQTQVHTPVQPVVQAPSPPPQVIPQVVPPVMPQVIPPVAPPAQAQLRCTRCGNLSPAGALFCPYCGQTFAQAVAPPPAPPPGSHPPSSLPKTIFCGNCGQANDWGSAFCGRCGTKLAY